MEDVGTSNSKCNNYLSTIKVKSMHYAYSCSFILKLAMIYIRDAAADYCIQNGLYTSEFLFHLVLISVTYAEPKISTLNAPGGLRYNTLTYGINYQFNFVLLIVFTCLVYQNGLLINY